MHPDRLFGPAGSRPPTPFRCRRPDTTPERAPGHPRKRRAATGGEEDRTMSANDETKGCRGARSRALTIALSAIAVLAARTAAAVCPTPAATFTPDPAFRSDFGLEECSFSSRGRNPFFILEPGYQITLESDEE